MNIAVSHTPLLVQIERHCASSSAIRVHISPSGPSTLVREAGAREFDGKYQFTLSMISIPPDWIFGIMNLAECSR